MGHPHLGSSRDGQGWLPAGHHLKQFLQDKVDMGSRFRWVEGCVRKPRDRRKQVDRGPERIRAGGAVGPVPSTHLWFVSSSQSEEAGRRKKRCW